MRFSALTPTFSDIKTWVRAATLTVNQLISGKQDKSANLTSLSGLDLTGHSGDAVVVTAGEDGFELVAGGGGGGTTTNALTITNTGGAAPGATFNGSAAKTIDYSTVGAQPLDSDLTAIAALTTTAYGRSLLEAANASALRTLAGAVIGTDVQAYDADLAALASNSTNGLWAHTGAGTGAARTITGSALITVTNGDGVSGNPTVTRAFSGALVKKSADETAANYSAFPDVLWDAEEYDTDNYHSTVSNTNRLTVPAAGYYRVGGHIAVASLAASDYIRLSIGHRDSANVALSSIGLPSAPIVEISATPTIVVMGMSMPILCAAGDFFTLAFDTESDTSITIQASTSWFGIERVA